MNQFKKMLRTMGDLLLLVVALFSIFAAISFFYLQATFVTITSASMEPALRVGDVAITERIHRLQIRTGDILVLPHPDNGSVKFAHRVVNVDRRRGETVIETKGDANPTQDSWRLKVTSAQVPKISAVLHRPNLLIDQHPFIWVVILFTIPMILAVTLSLKGSPESTKQLSGSRPRAP